jgi:hypothetical protein
MIRLTDARKRFLMGFVLAPLVQTAVCIPAYGDRIYRAILFMPAVPRWSMDRFVDLLRDLGVLAATAYGLAVVVGLPVLWGLRRLRFLNAPVVTAAGIAAGLGFFALFALNRSDSEMLGASALIGGALAAGPLAFSVISGLPWSLARTPVENSAESVFD